MKRVLVITYYWPPSGGSGVQRWLKFAKYLPEFGWEPVIYTPLNPEANTTDEALLKDVSPDTEVIKRRIFEPYGFYKALMGKRGAPIKANIISNGENKSLLHKLSMFVRGNLFIPDPRCLWIGPSVSYLKRYLRENPVDAIVSTGPPHSMHLIAKRVSKAMGIRWIADFRDPWTEIFYFKHLKLSRYALRRHKKLEQGVLDAADCVVVVSEKMREDFARRTKTPVRVVTNGFDPDDFVFDNKAQSGDAAGERKFSLVHTGIMVDNGNPDKLWRLLGEMAQNDAGFRRDLEIRTMGQVDQSIVDDINRCGLGNNFVNMGYVAHNEATGWQQRASLLLLPLRKEPEAAAILTGKFFEYVAASRPILAFGPVKSNLATALQESQSGVICEWEDEVSMKMAIDSAYRRFLSGEEPAKGEFTAAQLKYSRKSLTGELSGLLNGLISKK